MDNGDGRLGAPVVQSDHLVISLSSSDWLVRRNNLLVLVVVLSPIIRAPHLLK